MENGAYFQSGIRSNFSEKITTLKPRFRTKFREYIQETSPIFQLKSWQHLISFVNHFKIKIHKTNILPLVLYNYET
jgi:hypothetical protein